MKRLLIVISLFFVAFQAMAQHQEARSNPKDYIGKHFRVDTIAESSRKYGYHYFVLDYTKSALDNGYYFVEQKDGTSSDYETLVNKIFVCIDAAKVPDGADYYLKLKNDQLGTTYYLYSSILFEVYCIEDEENLKREVQRTDSIALSYKNNPCLLIEDEKDNISRTRDIKTPSFIDEQPGFGYKDPVFFGISYDKRIEKGITSYYADLTTSTTVPSLTEKGVIILLKNGQRILKPSAEVRYNTNRNSSGYSVSSYIQLLPADLALLKASPAVEFKLYTDYGKVENPDIVYKLFLCWLSKK